MVFYKNILLLATAVTASVLPRDAAQVMNDLRTMNSDTLALTTTVNAYTGGTDAAVAIIEAESKLDNDIKSATTDAGNSGTASAADAKNIIAYVSGTLEPNMKTSLTALKSKKPQFDAAGLSSAVGAAVTSLKQDTDAFGAAMIAHPLAAVVADAQAMMATIDADLDDIIKFYS